MTVVIKDFTELLPSGILGALGGVESAIDSVLADIMEGARDKWGSLARERLHATQEAYTRGIGHVELSPGMGVITLLGELANAIEQGLPAMDMHDTLLGPNVPEAPMGQRGKHPIRGQDGKFYRAIPFRHAGPGAGGTTGAPMGKAYGGMLGAGAAKAKGKEIYQAAKTLAPTTGQPYGPTQWGGRLPAGMALKLKPHHAVDIYAGMVRMEKTYQKGPQSTYMTFRTISDTVPEKWHRKATPGLNLVEEVATYVEEQAPKAFEALLAEFT